MLRYFSGKQISLLLLFFACLASVALFLLFLPSVRAQEAPLWGAQAANFSLKIEKDNYTPPDNAGEYCEYRDFKVSNFHRVGLTGGEYREEVYNECASNYNFGTASSGDNRLLQLKGVDKPYRLKMSETRVAHMPGGDSLFLQIGRRVTSLAVYDNPLNSFRLTERGENGPERIYLPKDDVVPRTLTDSNGDNVRLEEVDASPNGEWLIVDLGEGDELARVNPDTFELLTFPGGVSKYNQFSNPDIDMAISNDGRYVAMAGGSIHTETFKLYDLSTCVPDPNYNLHEATGCDPKDSRITIKYLEEQLGGDVDDVAYLQFNDDATQLSATISLEYPSGERERKLVTLTAAGYDEPGLDYLALGDSYSSGEGDIEGNIFYLPGTNGTSAYPDEKCHVSTRSYPFLLAGGMGLPNSENNEQFASVACSGAVMDDIDGNYDDKPNDPYIGHFGQFNKFADDPNKLREEKNKALKAYAPGRAAQIEFVKKYKPKAITVGVGGNDIGFEQKLTACIFSEMTNLRASCAPALTETNARAKVGDQIRRLYSDLKQLYEKLRQASSSTKVYAVGYPDIVKTGTACHLNVPLDDNEREYAKQVVHYLNAVIEAAARDAGVDYIDIEDSLATEDIQMCSGPNTGVNGVSLGDDLAGIIGNESFHPNARGHWAMAKAIQSELPNLVNNPGYCNGTSEALCPTDNVDSPPLPDYFVYETDPFIQTAYNHSIMKGVIQAPARLFNTTVTLLKPGSNMYFELRSEPVSLGTYTADADGTVNAELTIPEDTPPGYHELHAIGTAPDGEPIDYYDYVLVITSETDYDGDGIPNAQDKCTFIQPANVDKDKDGIDDACDPEIGQSPKPEAPTLDVPEFINASSQQNFTVSGRGDTDTTASITVDDDNPETEAISAKVQIGSSSDTVKLDYQKDFDITSLSDGQLTITVTLANETGESPVANTTATKDTKPPVISATTEPDPNSYGWHNDDAVVILTAEDTEPGTGIENLTYNASGATATPSKVVESEEGTVAVTIPINQAGVTTLTYFAEDKAGNQTKTETFTLKLDQTAPITTIDSPAFSILLLTPRPPSLFNRELTGTATDNTSGIIDTKVTFKNKHTSTTLPATCTSNCDTAKNTNWSLKPTTLPTGVYTVTAISTDKAGNTHAPDQPIKLILINPNSKFKLNRN